ncbi:site-2 protease family protein [Chitinophaga ginsengisegetis]|uniref:site-2 protease family protein n=1 Tax=Chitinophaga ginsengisegetis TaxID=393003 RepID=UPI003445E0DE
MKNSLKLFTIKYTSIYLHWSFGLFVALILFIQSATGTANSEILWSAMAIIAVFTCVVLHELGHSLAAGRYGIRTKSITLLPIGGIAAMEKMPDKPVPEIIVSAAGPMVNLLIALILLPFISGYPPFWKAAEVIESVDQGNFLYYLYVVNIMLALFNLIPAFPMDGGRILKGILELRMDTTRSTAIAAFTGRVIAALFIVAGLIIFDIILMLIGLFIIASGAGEEKLIYLKTAAKGLHLKDLATTSYSSFPAGMTIGEAAEKMLLHQDKYFLVMDQATVAGIIERSTILRALSGGKHGETIRQLMTANVPKLDAESLVTEVIDKLSGNRAAALPVVSEGRITGTVNMQNIIEYLTVHDTNLKEHNHSGAMYRFLQTG